MKKLILGLFFLAIFIIFNYFIFTTNGFGVEDTIQQLLIVIICFSFLVIGLIFILLELDEKSLQKE